MQNEWTQKWNTRYSEKAFAFGTEPNGYFKEQIEKLPPGKLLLPAEGEGRNAVFAALRGWQVSAFDISTAGKDKALQLANTHNVTLEYQVGHLEEVEYKVGQFDTLALIYAHFPADIKSRYHQTLATYVKQGGTVILEAFGKNHLEYKTSGKAKGGPGNLASLFSVEELQADFTDFEITELEEKEVTLNAGSYHSGVGSVVRFVGRKK